MNDFHHAILAVMLTSVAWLNRYLNPATVTADEAEHVLTHVGFPIESRETLPSGDVRLDVELTSNRGDCLCHLGLAREIAAATGRTLVVPAPAVIKPSATKSASVTSIENQRAADGCPRFTARVIRGVKVGPSPAWLREALESVGLRSINNVVDVTNFINLELGHPCHVFDLNTLAGKRLIVRYALPKEPITALDGRKHAMQPDEIVVADAEKAVSIAGVIGGLETGVTDRTTDVLFEMATWDPIAVRRAARRLDIRTDASHRFERYVDARDLEWASLRAASLIVELAGGELLDGMIDAAAAPRPRATIELRVARCEHLLGIAVSPDRIESLLRSIGIDAARTGAGNALAFRCAVPHHRHDLTREIDLIEEVARLNGFEQIRLAPALAVDLQLTHPEAWSRRERAAQAITDALNGSGFFETVTFSFITKDEAQMFLPSGLRLLQVDEERRKGAPFLRPSILPSLLTCRRANQDGQVRAPLGVRLFETASVFAEQDDGNAFARATREQRHLALLMDAGSSSDEKQAALRALRGVIEHLVSTLGGTKARAVFDPAPAHAPGLHASAYASIRVNEVPAGYLTLISDAARARWGIETHLAAAELCLSTLIGLYPPAARVGMLPAFPAIERDLSVIVEESVPFARFEQEIAALSPALMERLEYVGAYRGKQVGDGKKSMTLRMTFRDEARTLRHEEVDPQMNAIIERLSARLGGVVRTA